MNYRTHIVSSLAEIGQPAWDALVARQDKPNPFLSYAFLHALHESGSASEESGWQPQFIVLYDGEVCLGGAVIDFVDTIEKQGFTIDNPNATGSCACGDSFS